MDDPSQRRGRPETLRAGDSPSAEGAESQLAGALADLLSRLDAGETITSEQLQREHPHGWEDLAQSLELHRALTGQLDPLPEPGRRDPSLKPELRAAAEGRYVDFTPIGEGGMGTVHLALDTELNRLVALKMVRLPGSGDDEQEPSRTPLDAHTPVLEGTDARAFDELKARLLQEAWVTGGLEHPGVVPVYELGQTDGGVPYYTMRFVRGQRTLTDALDSVRDAPTEERLRLLEPFLKLCDTVAYAHSRGVVHRDLKPANVALGGFGEVMLLDWGLAKVRGADDVAAGRWEARVEAFRETSNLQTVAGVIGTPGYMAPEAALGRLEEVGPKSDIFSLGAILFEILTGRLPFEVKSYQAYVDQISRRDAPKASSLIKDVPQTLSDLCASCLARDATERPTDVDAVAEAIRRWQASTLLNREIDAHLRDIRAALKSAEEATAEMRLGFVDVALARMHQIEEKRPGLPEVEPLRTRAAALREQSIKEREKASVKRFFRRGGVVVLALAAVAAVLVGMTLEQRRKKAEGTLREVLRLSDAKKVHSLEEEALQMAISDPKLGEHAARWFEQVRDLVSRRSLHTTALTAVRERARNAGPPWVFDDPDLDWQHDVLADMLKRLTALEEPKGRYQSAVRRMHDLARELKRRETSDADTWREIRASIAADPRYGGLRLAPQRGLAPLGRDPDSKLYEFACLGTGSVPKRIEEVGPLTDAKDAAIVLVLIPGGTAQLGTTGKSWSKAIGVPQADPTGAFEVGNICSVHQETLGAYFLAKHECTQAQWRALSAGSNPSFYAAPQKEPRRPVEQVSWNDCVRWLPRFGLTLPTEDQWEYACRAGTTMPYSSGSDPAAAHRAGWFKRHDQQQQTTYGVGLKRANPFGLHDMHGNVWEWCLDPWPRPETFPVEATSSGSDSEPMRPIRGASWFEKPIPCYWRVTTTPDYDCFHLGVRPARAIVKD